MRLKFILSILFLCLFLTTYGQEKSLSKEQMLEDFDQLVHTINSFAVYKELNALRLGINYEKEYKKLRNKISENTSTCDFIKILRKVIFLLQDQHCNILNYSFLEHWGKYQKVRLNYGDGETYETTKYYDENCWSTSQPKLRLPLLYLDGSYYLYSDIVYKNDTIYKGTEITKFNGKKIHKFIANNYDRVWVAKWDQREDIPYNMYFYLYGDDDFDLAMKYQKRKKKVTFNRQDSIIPLSTFQRHIFYGSQKKEQILHFKEQNILYIGLPSMNIEQSKSIMKGIDSIVKYNPEFSKVIIDIRGNGGGTDVAWRNVISHIIPKSIDFPTNIKYKYNDETIDFYGKGTTGFRDETIDFYKNGKTIEPEKIPLLDGLYWSKIFTIKEIKPDSASIRHQGKIYVLQDEFIYSSAGNLANFCLNSDDLISVGTPTGLVGGNQAVPIFAKLKHSETFFRLEPVLDLLHVKTIEDFMHDKVEVHIPKTLEGHLLRRTYKGDIYGEEFLLQHDPLVRFVLKD